MGSSEHDIRKLRIVRLIEAGNLEGLRAFRREHGSTFVYILRHYAEDIAFSCGKSTDENIIAFCRTNSRFFSTNFLKLSRHFFAGALDARRDDCIETLMAICPELVDGLLNTEYFISFIKLLDYEQATILKASTLWERITENPKNVRAFEKFLSSLRAPAASAGGRSSKDKIVELIEANDLQGLRAFHRDHEFKFIGAFRYCSEDIAFSCGKSASKDIIDFCRINSRFFNENFLNLGMYFFAGALDTRVLNRIGTLMAIYPELADGLLDTECFTRFINLLDYGQARTLTASELWKIIRHPYNVKAFEKFFSSLRAPAASAGGGGSRRRPRRPSPSVECKEESLSSYNVRINKNKNKIIGLIEANDLEGLRGFHRDHEVEFIGAFRHRSKDIALSCGKSANRDIIDFCLRSSRFFNTVFFNLGIYFFAGALNTRGADRIGNLMKICPKLVDGLLNTENFISFIKLLDYEQAIILKESILWERITENPENVEAFEKFFPILREPAASARDGSSRRRPRS